MQLCSLGHQEVCYDGGGCPVCDMEGEKDDAIAVLEEKVKKLEQEVANLNISVESLL